MFRNPFQSRQNNDAFSGLESKEETAVDENLFEQESGTQTEQEKTDTHAVDPHYVQDYYQTDGTHVEGYWRDGDSDTAHDLTAEEGGGYLQSNPDGDVSHNGNV